MNDEQVARIVKAIDGVGTTLLLLVLCAFVSTALTFLNHTNGNAAHVAEREAVAAETHAIAAETQANIARVKFCETRADHWLCHDEVAK